MSRSTRHTSASRLTGTTRTSRKPIAQGLAEAGPCIRHVQLSDSNRLEPGAGHIDWSATLATLWAIGYDAELALECRLSGADDEVLRMAVRRMRQFAWS